VITHDLDVVAHLCTRLCVMYAGRIVESGEVSEVLDRPRHPYTRLLVESRRKLVEASGEPASPHALPTGCAFHPRCAYALERCRLEEPKLEGEDHAAACFVFGGR
jgi:peptide/nickel transport system ATP-binding protein